MIELLEGRRLMSISAFAGYVWITGSGAADTITVTGTGTDITIAGTAGAGSYTNVRLLSIDALGGDDIVTMDDTILTQALIRGGSGKDQITAGGGNDLIWGDDGNDIIHGGSGIDNITGGNGNDDIYGDGGKDVVQANDGSADTIHKDALDIILKDKKDVVL